MNEVAKTPQCIGLRNRPTQFGTRRQLQWMLQHRHPQTEPGAQKAEHHVGLFTQVFRQDRGEFFLTNPSRDEALAVMLFGEKRLAAMRFLALPQPLLKRQILERVQRVVMHEDRDRALRWQQMRRVFDRLLEVLPGGSTARLDRRCSNQASRGLPILAHVIKSSDRYREPIPGSVSVTEFPDVDRSVEFRARYLLVFNPPQQPQDTVEDGQRVRGTARECTCRRAGCCRSRCVVPRDRRTARR